MPEMRYCQQIQVDSLTDFDLMEIATRVAQEILEAGIWDDIPFIARLVLAEKEDFDVQTTQTNVVARLE